jgi:hypothetical protein
MKRKLNMELSLYRSKNCSQVNDTKVVGMKLFASYVFKDWTEEEQYHLYHDKVVGPMMILASFVRSYSRESKVTTDFDMQGVK